MPPAPNDANVQGKSKHMPRDFYTIGYEGSRVEEFVAALRRAGVVTLIDVRDIPLSRKPGFSKSALAANLAAKGIAYVHLRGLGDPKPGREAARAGKYGLFRSIFGRHMTTDVARRDLELISGDGQAFRGKFGHHFFSPFGNLAVGDRSARRVFRAYP
jgi:Protein of unknown function, DUF488